MPCVVQVEGSLLTGVKLHAGLGVSRASHKTCSLQALVKARVCPDCAVKLNWKKQVQLQEVARLVAQTEVAFARSRTRSRPRAGIAGAWGAHAQRPQQERSSVQREERKRRHRSRHLEGSSELRPRAEEASDAVNEPSGGAGPGGPERARGVARPGRQRSRTSEDELDDCIADILI
jgi:hypothetical protein